MRVLVVEDDAELGQRDLESIRAFFLELLGNSMTVARLPDYLGGFVQALQFAPQVAGLVNLRFEYLTESDRSGYNLRFVQTKPTRKATKHSAGKS